MACYSDFLELNDSFTPVFRLDTDTKNANIWRRYIFTKNSFGNILSNLAPIFRNQIGERRAFILQGTYGIGKSHATSVLSHILWDDTESIDKEIRSLKHETGEIGFEFDIYRNQVKKRLFPVLLYQQDSQDAWYSNQAFDIVLEKALERALKEQGYSDQITEKTDYIRYYNWIESLRANKRKVIDDLQDFLTESDVSEYQKVETLINGIKTGETEALKTIRKFVINMGLASPASQDAKSYYIGVLKELQLIDPSIDGIVIYWDEFTTVFQQAGKAGDAALVNNIQNWAELCKDGIFLFLVSHRGPEEFAGVFKDMQKDFAKISDRFKTIRLSMDKVTTYRLISSSIMIKDGLEEDYSNFKKVLAGYSDTEHKKAIRDIFQNETSTEETNDIVNSFPIHPYSILFSTKLAEIVGSVERSIFEMLHNKDEREIGPTRVIGFGKFLMEYPMTNQVIWYSPDHVFDFFYAALNDSKKQFELPEDLQQMMCFYKGNADELKRKFGVGALSILKATILLDAFSFTGEPFFRPIKKNIENCFLMIESPEEISDLLWKMEEGGYLRSYGSENNSNKTYKIPPSVGDNQSLGKKKEELRKNKKFSDLLSESESKLEKYLLYKISSIKRNIKISLIKTKKTGLKEVSQGSCQKYPASLSLVLCIPENKEEGEDYLRLAKETSNKVPDAVFIVAEGEFSRYFDKYIDFLAEKTILEEQGNHNYALDLDKSINQNYQVFINDIRKVKIIFRKESELRDIGDMDAPLYKIVKEIFSKGFDDKKYSYDQFWKTPKANSERILINYGKDKAKDILVNEGQFYEKKMADVLRDTTGSILVDDDLSLLAQDHVRETPFYEIVSGVRNYVKSRSGEKISLRGMIDDLGLEKPPYGLCGWIESIIITYALADFYIENKLEVFKGVDSATKHSKVIIDAINSAISTTKNGKDLFIRYGTQTEKDIIDTINRQLGERLAISDNNPTLDQVKFALRDSINKIGLPICLVPYSEKDDVEWIKFIDTIRGLIRNEQKTDEEMDLIRDSLLLRNNKLDSKYWCALTEVDKYQQGLNIFVGEEFSEEYHTYFNDNVEQLIGELKIIIQLDKDVWLWDDDKLRGKLLTLFKNKKTTSSPVSEESEKKPSGEPADVKGKETNDGNDHPDSGIRQDLESIAIDDIEKFALIFRDTFASLKRKTLLSSQTIDRFIEYLRGLRDV